MLVKFCDLTADIDNHEEAAKTLSALEIVRYQISPVVALAGGYSREPVAREINETAIIVEVEEINELRPAWCLARARKLPPIDNDIDRAGLSGIRSTGKGDLGALIRDELCGCVSTLDEFSFWVLRHWGTSRGLCV